MSLKSKRSELLASISNLYVKLKPKKCSQTCLSPINTTPLITNFAKWSGKRKLLLLTKNSDLYNEIKPMGLDCNLFASLLSSPMRCDKISKLKTPQDMLIKLKIKQSKSAEVDPQQEQIGRYKLLPVVKSDKIGQSSYVTNNLRALKNNAKKANNVLPTSVRNSTMRSIESSEISVDIISIIANNKQGLLNLIKKQLKNHQVAEREPLLEPTNDGVFLVFNDKLDNDIEIGPSKEGGERKIVTLNLKNLGHSELGHIMGASFVEGGRRISVRFSQQQELIIAVYKLLAMSH